MGDIMSNNYIYPDNRVVKTKKRLKDALLSLLHQNNFTNITIMDIVMLAKVNRGTFYNHYKDKNDLIDEIINDIMSDLIYSYRNPYQNLTKFKFSDISPSSVKLFDHVYKNHTFYFTVVHSDIIGTFQNRLYFELSNLVLYDISISNPNINTKLYANYIASAISGMMIEWVREGFKYSPEYMANQLVQILNIPPNQTLIKRRRQASTPIRSDFYS